MPFSEVDGTPLRGVAIEQEPDGRNFHVLRGFVYRDPIRDETVDVPVGLQTDLASVPWFLWWLIASYGKHTAASVVHDYLIVDKMTRAERVRADAIFFHALEESGNNWYRHRVMWAAVCAGLTMRKATPGRCVLFFAHLAAFWLAVLWAVGALGWLERQPWLTWIPGERSLPFHHHFAAAALAAAVLLAVGFAWAWAPTADRPLRFKLWPSAVTAVGIIALPTLVIGAAALIVYGIDWLAALGQWLAGRGYEKPTPPRARLRPVRAA